MKPRVLGLKLLRRGIKSEAADFCVSNRQSFQYLSVCNSLYHLLVGFWRWWRWWSDGIFRCLHFWGNFSQNCHKKLADFRLDCNKNPCCVQYHRLQIYSDLRKTPLAFRIYLQHIAAATFDGKKTSGVEFFEKFSMDFIYKYNGIFKILKNREKWPRPIFINRPGRGSYG